MSKNIKHLVSLLRYILYAIGKVFINGQILKQRCSHLVTLHSRYTATNRQKSSRLIELERHRWAGVVAQMVKQSISAPEVRGSNPVIG